MLISVRDNSRNIVFGKGVLNPEAQDNSFQGINYLIGELIIIFNCNLIIFYVQNLEILSPMVIFITQNPLHAFGFIIPTIIVGHKYC